MQRFDPGDVSMEEWGFLPQRCSMMSLLTMIKIPLFSYWDGGLCIWMNNGDCLHVRILGTSSLHTDSRGGREVRMFRGMVMWRGLIVTNGALSSHDRSVVTNLSWDRSWSDGRLQLEFIVSFYLWGGIGSLTRASLLHGGGVLGVWVGRKVLGFLL